MNPSFSAGDDLRPQRRLRVVAERLAFSVGPQATRYAVVLLLLFFGALKWTSAEAQGIYVMVVHSPLVGWLYPLLGLQGTAIVFGCFEIVVGVAIALRPWFPTVSAIGSAATIAMFCVTISFLFTTPGLLQSPDAGFIMKDSVLLGASIWCAGEALAAARLSRQS